MNRRTLVLLAFGFIAVIAIAGVGLYIPTIASMAAPSLPATAPKQYSQYGGWEDCEDIVKSQIESFESKLDEPRALALATSDPTFKTMSEGFTTSFYGIQNIYSWDSACNVTWDTTVAVFSLEKDGVTQKLLLVAMKPDLSSVMGFEEQEPIFFGGSSHSSDTGTITIVVNSIGADATFNFTATGEGLPSQFSITTKLGMASVSFSNLAPGVYTIEERTPTAPREHEQIALVSSSCSFPTYGYGSYGTYGYSSTVKLTLAAGDTIQCTFINMFIIPEYPLLPLSIMFLTYVLIYVVFRRKFTNVKVAYP